MGCGLRGSAAVFGSGSITVVGPTAAHHLNSGILGDIRARPIGCNGEFTKGPVLIYRGDGVMLPPHILNFRRW